MGLGIVVFEMVASQVCRRVEAGYDNHVCLIKLTSLGLAEERILSLVLSRNFSRVGSCSKMY